MSDKTTPAQLRSLERMVRAIDAEMKKVSGLSERARRMTPAAGVHFELNKAWMALLAARDKALAEANGPNAPHE